jgi:hypothetical protein
MVNYLDYTELDYQPNVPIPPPPKNAGLYTGDVLFDKKPWGNSYKMPTVEPDAVAYSAQFYASHHIPSYNRPGNNTVNTELYKKYTVAPASETADNYNFSCYTNIK